MYLIDTPPPTISGRLHMGHVFSYSHMDFVARFQKLKGKVVVYPFCYDCNGLPTEKLGRDHDCYSTEDILANARVVSNDYEALFRRMGMDLDYHRTYHTFSANAVNLALASFRDLRSKGLVYKAKRPVLFCPNTGCAVSQSEVTEDGCYERSGCNVEERELEYWYISVLNRLSEIRNKVIEIEWEPPYFKERLLKWLDGYKYDWCISRQRQYGIRIPDETDVFDTWFVSSMTPQLAWQTRTGGEAKLECPIFDVRFQAHDIIYTWALYTIIKSLYHNNQIPWRKIVVSGHALTGEGSKMSKSKGQNIPPLELLDKYGPDAIRYWAAHTQPGSDSQIDFDVMEKGKKLINKLKNAGRFLEMHEDEGENEEYRREWISTRDYIDIQMGLHCNWFYSLGHLTAFFWKSFCDKYIEESKKTPANRTLRGIYDEMLDYFEIFMPNIRGICEQ